MAEKPKTHRWFRFRLRTLLVVVVLVGVVLAPAAQKRSGYNRQKAILDQLVADRAAIRYHRDYGEWWQHIYDGESLLDTVARVNFFWGDVVTDLSWAAEMNQLEVLNISGAQVSDVSALSSLSQLQTLYISLGAEVKVPKSLEGRVTR